MTILQWTDERIGALATKDLQNLIENASKRGADELVVRCRSELSTRSDAKPRAGGKRTMQLRCLEAEMAEALGLFIKDLAKEFDLSPETAKRLSAGTKNFKAHNLTDPKGHAKTGGMHKGGLCELDRFVSYRVQDHLVSLNAWLAKRRPTDEVEFHVFGPKTLLTSPMTWDELRPGTLKLGGLGLYQHGERYFDLALAQAAMRSLIAALAPKQSSPTSY